jgi:hypothetical protein
VDRDHVPIPYVELQIKSAGGDLRVRPTMKASFSAYPATGKYEVVGEDKAAAVDAFIEITVQGPIMLYTSDSSTSARR